MKKLAVMFAGLILAIGLSSCSNEEEKECNHKWTDATCTEPSICSKCNEIGGEPLGHQWKAATCDSPKTCKYCNATEGEKLEHEWLEATCENPKTCKYCSDTAGREKGHTASQNVIEETNFKTASITYLTYCKDCGADMDKTVEKLTKLHENGVFYFTANELCDRMNHIFNTHDKWSTYYIEPVYVEEQETLLLVMYNEKGEPLGSITPCDININSVQELNSPTIQGFLCYGYDATSSNIIALVAMMACDPMLDAYTATDTMEVIFRHTEFGSNYEHNNIYYLVWGEEWEFTLISLFEVTP